MSSITSVALLVLSVIVGSSCWVFNKVDFAQLAAKGIDILEDMEKDFSDEGYPRLILIYPGTKWCGPGDIAESYDDLGEDMETDKCCRTHDHCPDTIPAGQTNHNLTNEAFYTRLSCACDEKFRQCLRAVTAERKTPKIIGNLYFNALGTKCYRMNYPVTGCKAMGGWLNKKCLQYSYNTSGQQKYQWFDVSIF